MLQRIQTLYLLLAACVTGLLFFFPLADLVNEQGKQYVFWYRGLYEITSSGQNLLFYTFPLAILLLISTFLSIIGIFMYKKRPLQMKASGLNIVILFAAMGIIAYYAVISYSKFGANIDYSIFATMPIIALILLVMAFYAIRKDERLVKSIDRIR